VRYIELTATVGVAQAEAAADVLHALTDGGVSIEASFRQHDLESDAVADADGRAAVRAYVRDGDDIDCGAVRATLAAAGVAAEVSARAVDEADWAEAWKEHFHAERFGRIVVVPSWRTHAEMPGDVVLRLDPGMAFGTGQHETTRMCLEALDRRVRPGMHILDVGCGSGILAIAATKLGAARVRALDIDPDCVRITGENARANGCGGVVTASVVTPGAPWWKDGASYDVVVANIIARTIVELAPVFARALEHGGHVIASGIIAEREREVSDALAAVGLRIDGVRALGEWRCIEAVR
jgi:ribosomal protein L11 methyltransferase